MSEDVNFLVQGEGILSEHSLNHAKYLFFAKSYFNVTNKRVIIKEPNLFWLIPIGKKHNTIPLHNISSVKLSQNISKKKLLIALGLLFLGLADFSNLFIFVLMGIVLSISAITILFSIQNTAGESVNYRVSLLDRGKAVELIDNLNKAISNYRYRP